MSEYKVGDVVKLSFTCGVHRYESDKYEAVITHFEGRAPHFRGLKSGKTCWGSDCIAGLAEPEKPKHKFKVGDKILVDHWGGDYTTYEDMAHELNLTDWKNPAPLTQNGVLYTIIAINDKHTYYGIKGAMGTHIVNDNYMRLVQEDTQQVEPESSEPMPESGETEALREIQNALRKLTITNYFKPKKEKTLMTTVTDKIKALKLKLNPDQKALYDAGFRDIDGNRTPAGREAREMVLDEMAYEGEVKIAKQLNEADKEEKKAKK